MAVTITSSKGKTSGSTPKNREVVLFYGVNDSDSDFRYYPDFKIRRIANIINYGTEAVQFEEFNFGTGTWNFSEIGGHPLLGQYGPDSDAGDSDHIQLTFDDSAAANDVSVLVEFRL